MIDCRHWSDCGIAGAGCCALKLFGGHPSLGTCRNCIKREPLPGQAVRTSAPARPAAFAPWQRDICAACHQLIGFPDQRRIECRAMQGRRKGGCACLRAGDTCPLGKWDGPRVDQSTGLTRLQWEARSRWWKNRHPWREPTPEVSRPGSSDRPPPAIKFDLTRYFDAVWCVNLDQSHQRWSEFNRQLAACDWPFDTVRRFSAIHGDTVGVPDYFHQGGGAWGCLQSHRRILEKSLMANHRRILVMEDDVDLRPNFGASVRQFLADLGDEPWDCLMLGGQHMGTPRPHKPGVVCPTGKGIQRTHCMALSGTFMRALYCMWSGAINQHCDWALGPFAIKYRTFAPERFIAGQRGGQSLIAGSTKPPEWWNPPPPDAPVIWLRSPRQVLESCRDIFHSGYRRTPEGFCQGLAAVFRPTAKNPREMLRRWIAMIQWECTSRGDGSVCTIWHPNADESVIRSVAGDALRIIQSYRESEARSIMEKMRGGGLPSHPGQKSLN